MAYGSLSKKITERGRVDNIEVAERLELILIVYRYIVVCIDRPEVLGCFMVLNIENNTTFEPGIRSPWQIHPALLPVEQDSQGCKKG
jgi:hypothetical protein